MAVKIDSLGTYEDEESRVAEIVVTHKISNQNEKTTLELNMDLRKNLHGWRAEIDFGEIPHQETPMESVLLLADWMERMANEIRKHDHHTWDEINLTQI